MKFRLLKTDIPVYNRLSLDEIVRYLRSEDLDGDLSEGESDRHATIQMGEASHTFYFKRLWENEERKDIAEIVKPERHGKKRNTTVRI